MSNNDFKPWWEKVNEFLEFEERDEFLRGATAYRPNLRQDIMFSMMSQGYVRNKFDKPEPYTGKKTK